MLVFERQIHYSHNMIIFANYVLMGNEMKTHEK